MKNLNQIEGLQNPGQQNVGKNIIMADGILQYGGKYYKISGGKVFDKPGVLKPWRQLSKHESKKILKEVERIKKDPKTKVYGKA